jgi:hypothetical protein
VEYTLKNDLDINPTDDPDLLGDILLPVKTTPSSHHDGNMIPS